MSLFYKVAYRLGFTPWEEASGDEETAAKVSEWFDREESGREPPYGRALDLGCGGGLWAIELARRGWEVVGVDMVPKALSTARERAHEAGVEVRLLQGDVTSLQAAGVGDGFRLVWDFGTVHGLAPAQRQAVGREVSVVAAPDASVLMLGLDARATGALAARREPRGHRGGLRRMEGDRRGRRRRVRAQRAPTGEERQAALVPARPRLVSARARERRRVSRAPFGAGSRRSRARRRS